MPYFDIVAAHEIGHIECNCNVFALRLLGNKAKDRFTQTLKRKEFGYSDEDIKKVLEEFDEKYQKEDANPSISGSIGIVGDRRRPIFLREIRPEIYTICREILEKAPFESKPEVEFFIEQNLTQKAVTVVNKMGPSWIYFHPLALSLEKNDFEALVAHELGHIYCQCGDEKNEYQIRADEFASRIVGKPQVYNLLYKYGLPRNDPRLIALE